jgi:3',5'-cyclic AMP phosphodiesterase CpdA
VTRILHLTDLHLAPIDSDAALGDYKENFVPLAERQQRVESMRTALAEFARAHPEQLDAVVVSGDITIAGDESGFLRFKEVLEDLGSALPPKDRIVVVPGNHDVTWFEQPSTAAHHGFFIPHIHAQDYVTPLLEGVDIRPDSSGARMPGVTRSPVLVAPDKGVLIIALNSSNASGVLEPTSVDDAEWATAFDALSADRAAAAASELKRLRLRDAARIWPAQLAAAKREILRVRSELKSDGVDPARLITIAVLHHQLLPVSPREELKPFEALSNLGQVREFLRAADVDIVLHGHKHEAAIYRDSVPRPGSRLDPDPHPVLVVAGAALGLEGYTGEAFRLLEVAVDAPLPRVRITPFEGVPEGGESRPQAPSETLINRGRPLGADGVARLQPVVGTTVSDVYRRVIAELERLPGEGPVANLICEVREIDDPFELPEAYPELDGIDAPEEWMKELVEWWQEPRAVLGPNLSFNHGGRLRRFGSNEIDQLDRAERALRNKSESGRAVMVLVDPQLDDLTVIERKFPAFCLVQLAIRRPATGPRRLDITAYFRKQEMRWWWPVNVAELASLQRQVCSRLSDEYEDLQPGAIVTMAGIAKAGKARPRVVVPKIDRLLDDDPAALWLLALSVAAPDHSGNVSLSDWKPVLDDLTPEKQLDPDGIPVAIQGLEAVVEALERLNVDGAAFAFMAALDAVLDQNRLFVNDSIDHTTWVKKASKGVEQARAALQQLQETDE